MSAPVKVGLAEFEIVPDREGHLHLVAEGYGRERFPVATFHSPRWAALARLLLVRGLRDVAPIIWEGKDERATLEEPDWTPETLPLLERSCAHGQSAIRFDGGNRAVVCIACGVILTHLRMDHP